MPQVKLLKIVFDTHLKDYEIPAFRGAVIETVGREHVVFHNHLGDDRFHYKYPVIQYKRHGRRAAIVCIKEGVDEIHRFFSRNSGEVMIGRDQRPLRVESVKLNKFQLQVGDRQFTYSIVRWQGLNSQNYGIYKQLDSLGEKIGFLEKKLTGNILSMAKGLDWTVDKNIELKITELVRQQGSIFKGSKLLTFDLHFRTNVFLPCDIGLGKGASVGFGTVNKLDKHIL